jgi:hypothetical protein
MHFVFEQKNLEPMLPQFPAAYNRLTLFLFIIINKMVWLASGCPQASPVRTPASACLMPMLLLPAPPAARARMRLLLHAYTCRLVCCTCCCYLRPHAPATRPHMLMLHAPAAACMHAMLLGMHAGTASACACRIYLLMKTLAT